MIKSILVALSIGAVTSVTAPIKPSPIPATPFSIVLEATPTGWSALCDSGCKWKELAFGCEQVCDGVVDANGLVTTATLRPEPTSFMFIVHRTRDGAAAESRIGTTWASLSWQCRSSLCRVRIDPWGVGPDTIRR